MQLYVRQKQFMNLINEYKTHTKLIINLTFFWVNKMPKHNPKEARDAQRRYERRFIKNNRKKISRKFGPYAIFIGVIAVVVVIGISVTNPSTSGNFTGEGGEDIIFTTINGGTINLADHQGKVIILYFFFLNCPSCATTDQPMANIDNSYSSSQLLVIPITIKSSDSTSALNNWRNTYNPYWEVVRDDNFNSISSSYGVSYTPTTVFFDKNGNYVTKLVGIDNFDSKTRGQIDVIL